MSNSRLDRVGETHRVCPSTRKAGPIIHDAIEKVGHAVPWIDQVPGLESDAEMVAPSFAQAQVQSGGGLLHHIGQGALGHQEHLGALNIERQSGHKVRAVIDVGQDTIDNVRGLSEQGTRVGVVGVLGTDARELSLWNLD